MAKLKEVRLGIIGVGGMGRHHLGYLTKGEVPRARITAVADIEPAALKRALEVNPKLKTFASGPALLDSGEIDAVIIATPHYFHPTLAIEAFKRGIHVMSEKPVAVTAQAAAACIAAHKKYPKVTYAVMFNQRTNPAWRKVKEIVASGELGEIRRVNWIITNWFRTQAYYNSGGWRATWGGEGGGVLINQCPHNLDLFQWFVGMPKRVQAIVGLGKWHDIEVDDAVTAMMEFENGATGVFITTTGEAPGTNRLEIVGDRGKIVSDGGPNIEFIKTDLSVAKFLKTSPESFATPASAKINIQVQPSKDEHLKVMQNFVRHILDGEPLIARAEEGIRGLELGNAFLMSGLTGKPVDLPTNRNAFEALIKKLAKTSKFKKVVKEAKADMGASFR